MVHTTTKNSRTTRLDSRPNAKKRQHLATKVAHVTPIADIRITRKQKGEKKEREVVFVKSGELKSKTEKLVRALRKKMKAIEELLAKQDAGETLDEQQLAKISKLDEVVAAMEELTAPHKGKNRSGDGNSGENELDDGDEVVEEGGSEDDENA